MYIWASVTLKHWNAFGRLTPECLAAAEKLLKNHLVLYFFHIDFAMGNTIIKT